MIETQKPSTKHWASENDKNFIAELIGGKKNKRLIWDGYHPDGRKKQYWQDQGIDWTLHLTGKLKQGGNLCYELDGKKVADAAVVDVDQQVQAKKFCSDLFALDTTAIPIKSPSGRWHGWKFYSKPVDVAVAAEWSRDTGMKLAAKDYKVDFGKCNPNKNGSDVGINYPFHSKQIPFDPRGKPYTFKQFKHRIRFNNYPYLAAATNLETGKNRYDALLYSACILHGAGKYKDEYIDAIVENFGTEFNDHKKIQKIKDGEYKNYTLKPETIKQKIGEMIDKDLEVDLELAAIAEPLEALEVQRYNSEELPQKRKFLIEGFCALGNVTSIAAAAGSGKTTAASLLAFCACTGIQFLGRNVYDTGNVLMVTNEETTNEMQLKLKAVEMEYGNIFDAGMDNYNIDFRTIEEVTKLAQFNAKGATPTNQFKQLEKLIEKNKYKLIVLDPLISLKQGVFDENSNDNMETLIRDFVVNLATKYNIAVIVIHHANKSSSTLFEEVGGKYIVDNVQMLNLARGASALGGAVRFAFSMVPMPQVVWEKQYEEIAKDQYSRNNLVGLFDAKANYVAIAEEPVWLDKVLKQVPTADDKTEEVITLRVSDINQLSEAAYESFKASNMKKVVALAPHIKSFFKLNNEKITQIEQGKLAIKHEPLNNLATYLAQKDPEFQNGTVKEATIKSRIKRLLMAACENANGVQLPNTNVYFKYWYDNYESKTKHKVTIERSDEDNPF